MRGHSIAIGVGEMPPPGECGFDFAVLIAFAPKQSLITFDGHKRFIRMPSVRERR